jgi:hypothetical protein
MAETKKNSFLFRMTVRTCFLLYYNFCLWNYVKELVPTRDFPGPQGPRLPHLRVQRYNISTNHQNNQPLFLKIISTNLIYTLFIIRRLKLKGKLNRSIQKTNSRICRPASEAGNNFFAKCLTPHLTSFREKSCRLEQKKTRKIWY